MIQMNIFKSDNKRLKSQIKVTISHSYLYSQLKSTNLDV